jgi:hypothetical protein
MFFKMKHLELPTDSLEIEFCYGVLNQCESFIYLDLIVKNREVL